MKLMCNRLFPTQDVVKLNEGNLEQIFSHVRLGYTEMSAEYAFPTYLARLKLTWDTTPFPTKKISPSKWHKYGIDRESEKCGLIDFLCGKNGHQSKYHHTALARVVHLLALRTPPLPQQP